MLMSPFAVCLSGLSRLMVFTLARCLKVQLECHKLWEGTTPVGNRPMLDDQSGLVPAIGPTECGPTMQLLLCCAVAPRVVRPMTALVVLGVNFISKEG